MAPHPHESGQRRAQLLGLFVQAGQAVVAVALGAGVEAGAVVVQSQQPGRWRAAFHGLRRRFGRQRQRDPARTGMALDIALANKPEQTRALAMTAYGVGTTLGRTLPHSRTQELEADRMGLTYMARAGYDPREAVAFWQRFKAYKGSGGSVPAFLSTHPTDDRRIAQLERLLPDAIKEYEKSGGQSSSTSSSTGTPRRSGKVRER